MLKAKIIVKNDYQKYMSLFDNVLFSKFGIDIVKQGEDIVIAATPNLENIPKTIPVILLEKYAATTPRPETISILNERSNVLAIYKNWTASHSYIKTVTGRIHFAILNKTYKLNLPEVDFKHIDKVKQVVWNLHYSAYSDYFLKSLRSVVPKKNTLLNASFSIPDYPLLNLHRTQARLCALNNKGITEILPKQAYDEALLKSKIVLSPWGYGEYCMRDYEAVLAESFIIKPLPYIINDGTGLYNSTNIVSCNVQFTDLEQAIQICLDDQDRLERIRLIKNKILNTTKEDLVKRFCEETFKTVGEK